MKARVVAPTGNRGAIEVRLRLRVYDEHDQLRDVDGDAVTLKPGAETVLEWTLPEFGGQPIAEIGFAISGSGKRADGKLLVDYLRWDGAPSLVLRRPGGDCDFWRMAWVNGVDIFSKRFRCKLPHLAEPRRGADLAWHAAMDRLRGQVRHRHPPRQLRGYRSSRPGSPPLLRRAPHPGG